MAITGRAALVAAAGALLAPLGSRWLWGLEGLLLLAVLVDLALAGRVADLRLERSGATSTRLGERAEVVLTGTNMGSRRLRGGLRDAWVPSAGARPRAQRLDAP